MSLDDTVAFVAVARTGGFTRAGRSLGVPKATLSRRVQRLEERLGVRLLQRTTRTLSLTEAGRAFFDRCLHAVEELEDAERAAADVSAAPRGVLKVSAPFDFGRDYLVGWLAEFRERYPEVELTLELTQRRVDLIAEGFDIALRAGVLSGGPNLIAKKLAQSDLVLCASPRYLDRRGAPNTLSDLARHDCVEFGPGPKFLLTGPKGPVELDLRPWLTVNEFGTIRQAVLAGAGIGLLLEPFVVDDVAAGRLRRVLAEYRVAGGALFAVYPSSHHLTPKVRVFIDFLAAHLPHGSFRS